MSRGIEDASNPPSTLLSVTLICILLTQHQLRFCRAGFRSEARYIVSNDTGASGGTGFVNTLAFAVTFAAGVLSAFTWDDVGCNNCGGSLGANCLQTDPLWNQPQHSCACMPLPWFSCPEKRLSWHA